MSTGESVGNESGSRNDGTWWLGLVAGLVSMVLGLLLVIEPRRSLRFLAWLAGIGLIMWGVRQAMAAFRSPDRFDRSGGLFVALVTLGLGLAVVLVPDISLQLLRVLVGIAVIVWGLVDTGRPIASGRSRWWGFLVRGLGTLVLGLALIFWPEPTASVIGILLGILLLLWGLFEVVASWVLRPRTPRSVRSA
jgi:uncharacterized membrane protein HdeD (DUF308 family)